MAFSLKRQSAKVSHLNVREEKHGEDPVVAVDVKVKADLGNEFLDLLSPGLRLSLYAKGADGLAGMEEPLSVLRFPQLAPIDWEAPMVGCGFVVHGARKADDLEFVGDVSKPLRLAPKEGGTVEVTFQVQVLPSAEQLGSLSAFLGRATKVSVRPVEQASAPPAE